MSDKDPLRRMVNLARFSNLSTLDLSGNKISAMNSEQLIQLSNLTILKLGQNQLKSLAPIASLTSLRMLDVSGNMITSFPSSIRALAVLEELDVSGNAFEQVETLSKLKSLSNLTILNLASNPWSKVKHLRLYVVHHLPSVSVLDTSDVMDRERKEAMIRYGDTTVVQKKLERALASQSKKMDATSAEVQKLERQNQQLQAALALKDHMLSSKTKDLTDTVSQLSAVESSLKMISIDHPEVARDALNSLENARAYNDSDETQSHFDPSVLDPYLAEIREGKLEHEIRAEVCDGSATILPQSETNNKRHSFQDCEGLDGSAIMARSHYD